MKQLKTIYTPEQQARLDAANKKGVAGFRKQFVKKATDAQKLAALLASCSDLLDAYYAPPEGVEYARKVSLAIRALRSVVVDVRPGASGRGLPAASGQA